MQALYDLAIAWRAQFDIPVIGVTGSVGKTSTKEFIGSMLTSARKKHLISYGNQNTLIGASLNILKIRPEHEVAVFEMGISRPGEMAALAHMIRPTMGVITAIGHSHMEGLGSLHDIALEKRSIFKYFTENNIGVINGDQPLLSRVGYSHPVVKFGFKTTNQIQARKVRIIDTHARFTLKIYQNKYEVSIDKPHLGAVSNTLAAAAVAHLLGISDEAIVEGIQNATVVAGRFEQKKLRSGTGILINDCYNANPESMKAALLAFQKIETPAKKIAVIGDMLELGVNSPFWHRQVGRFLRKVSSLKQVILVGNMVEWTKKTIPLDIEVIHVPTWSDAVGELERMVAHQESMVLVKGSLGMGLLNLVNQCTEHGTN
jgi:UDP-N-acetylmuramoyl-tripeptide--D-alanyl-D-alanine ligase